MEPLGRDCVCADTKGFGWKDMDGPLWLPRHPWVLRGVGRRQTSEIHSST